MINTKKEEHKTKRTSRSIQGRDLLKRKTINQYSFIKNLGKGSFAKVKLAECGEKKEKFAIKIFDRDELNKRMMPDKDGDKKKMHTLMKNVMDEIDIMSSLNHPNVIRIHEIINDPDDKSLFIVMEYAAKGELLSFNEETGRFYKTGKDDKELEKEQVMDTTEREREIRRIMRELVNGLEYVHSKGIIHRDLKPENLLVDEKGIVKIADFGVAHQLKDPSNDMIHGSIGTNYFMSPECCQKLSENGYSGKASDIWSLGVCLYVLITMKLPFVGSGSGNNQMMDLFEKIANSQYEPPKNTSTNLSELLSKLLEKKAENRITIDEIKKHPFMTGNQKT